jgi:peptidoglycan/LPS O-acetylase OafA/YrhL
MSVSLPPASPDITPSPGDQRVRNRYFDLLRAAAIMRVVLYHASGWAMLSIFFPAMGVMFALAGSLMAASLDRYGTRALARRARRLLPPLWAVAAVAVPAMLLTGLLPNWRLVFWLAPLQDPPMNQWGSSVLGLIWYLREYLWFVLISPLALPLFRRWPVPTFAVPLAVLVAVQAGLPTLSVMHDFGRYFGCWLLGFAHHDGRLRRMPRWLLVGLALASCAAGAAWFLTHPGPRGYDLNDIPIGDMLWSTGFVLLLIGLAPGNLSWLGRMRPVSWLVAALNRRAVTIYLWHPAVVIGLGTVVGLVGWNLGGPWGRVGWLAAVLAALIVPVFAVGWVEDMAAGRRVRLVPAPRPAPSRRGLPSVAHREPAVRGARA